MFNANLLTGSNKVILKMFAFSALLPLTLLSVAGPSSSAEKLANCTVQEHISSKFCVPATAQWSAIECNGLNLTFIPSRYPTENSTEICLLDLSNNDIKIVNANAFVHVAHIQVLDLQENRLSYIATGAFNGLSNLTYLNLTQNNLTWPKSFGKGVFKPLIHLLNINIKENKFTTFVGMATEMLYMKALHGLYIDACANCTFGPGFENLTTLSHLSLSGRSAGACDMRQVGNTTFLHLPQIKKLWMSFCNISSIEANAFAPLKKLDLLDISYNEKLGFSRMNKALYGLRNSTTLFLLNVNCIHKRYGRGTRLKIKHVENLSTLKKLSILHMDLNKLEIFETAVLSQYQFPAHLEEFTLSGNRMTYGEYVGYIQNAKSLQRLDLSRQHLNYDPFKHEHYGVSRYSQQYPGEGSLSTDCNCHRSNNDSSCARVVLPEKIRFLKWRKSFLDFEITKMILCGPAQLEVVDLSFNLISKWIGPVYGVDSIKELDLSENYCDEVHNTFFHQFSALEQLNVAGNFLGVVLHPKSQYQNDEIFGKLQNLTHLDLSSNKIKHMHQNVFAGLKSLRYLNLRLNMIDQWDYPLDNSMCLRMLDLSSNQMDTLPGNVLKNLDSLVNTECNKNETVTVNLTANPIECTCHTLPFLKWMYNSKIYFHFASNDQCRLKGGERFSLDDMTAVDNVINRLEDECKDRTWIPITFASLASCAAGMLVCVCVYKYRWKLRYIYYKRNQRYTHEGFEWLFENDAFISYAKNNGSFIKNKLVPALEGQHNLKVWVADRNSTPGASVAGNITHAIYSSRKSVLLVNRKYLKEGWCDYEMNMALTESVESKRKLIIIVLMEDIPTREFNVSFLKLLKNEKSLEYPIHPQNMDIFWSNLADAIMT